MKNNVFPTIKSFSECFGLRGLTTPKMPYRIRSSLTWVVVVQFLTGRTAVCKAFPAVVRFRCVRRPRYEQSV